MAEGVGETMGLCTCTMYGGGGVSQKCRMHAGQGRYGASPASPSPSRYLRLPPRAFVTASLLPKHQGSAYLPRLSQSVRVTLRFLAGQKYSLPRCTRYLGPSAAVGR